MKDFILSSVSKLLGKLSPGIFAYLIQSLDAEKIATVVGPGVVNVLNGLSPRQRLNYVAVLRKIVEVLGHILKEVK